MLSKKEIDALLQQPKPIVRTATEHDRKRLEAYINAHPERVSDELRAFVAQLASREMKVTNETAAFIAFSGQIKQSGELHDSWFISIPKEGGF